MPQNDLHHGDPRQLAPATQRNREPILAVLREVLPTQGQVLEVASGSGEHAVHFAAAFPGLVFQPSDPDPAALASIDAWAGESTLPNLRPAIRLDASAPRWPVTEADAILCINMIHISPWAATEGLVRQAAELLPAGGPLYLYGPYRQSEVPLAPSNAVFDDSLRRRNPKWGLRELDSVAELARAAGFGAPAVTTMPANNLSVVFRRL
jgi:SAM-dependent methyltransferase